MPAFVMTFPGLRSPRAEPPAQPSPRPATARCLAAAPDCVVCAGPMTDRIERDLWWCARCRYWGATSGAGAECTLDEARRFAGLAAARRRGAGRVLAVLARHRRLAGARVCDVGCGYGWFLEAARVQSMTVLGIEPDPTVAAAAARRGLDVRIGFFPDCLDRHERFDVIAFQDVLEHVPDVAGAIVAARAHLTPGGVLVISVPSSTGALFRGGRLLRRLGIHAAWERLWQRRFPSPHLHFFDADNLSVLLARFGFERRESARLPMVELRGLWSRARMDRDVGFFTALVGVALVVLLRPLLAVLPPDVIVHVYGRVSEPAP